MKTFKKFEYERKRGIVWVCDVEHSSKYLNSNESANDIEEYLPRLYWTSYNLVKSFGGEFIKWTGDGFLAWFDSPLDRNKTDVSNRVYEAAWHLSFLNNVTQLALNPKQTFKIRHGITYEKDALLIKIFEEDNKHSLDLIGRAVVLAFRLSGIKTDFPNIVTEKEIALNYHDYMNFDKWEPSENDILKYFKGETLGISDIFVSKAKQYDKDEKRISQITEKATKIVNKTGNKSEEEPNINIRNFVNLMSQGPEWCQQIINIEANFIKEDLLGSLKKLIDIANERKNAT